VLAFPGQHTSAFGSPTGEGAAFFRTGLPMQLGPGPRQDCPGADLCSHAMVTSRSDFAALEATTGAAPMGYSR